MHLTIIAKQPIAGSVKTRLCPPCTPEQAADLAAAALLDTLDAVDAVVHRSVGDIEPVLLFDGDPEGWALPGFRVVAQRDGGLGERLAHGFDVLGPGIIVGMESSPAIPALFDGLAMLRLGVDVLGFAVDGGYWAIGLATADRAVFDSVPMSTSRTGIAQLRRMHQCGRQVHLLPVAHDLDTIDDVRVAVREQPDTRLGSLGAEVIASL